MMNNVYLCDKNDISFVFLSDAQYSKISEPSISFELQTKHLNITNCHLPLFRFMSTPLLIVCIVEFCGLYGSILCVHKRNEQLLEKLLYLVLV